jgi:hypothetical protein
MVLGSVLWPYLSKGAVVIKLVLAVHILAAVMVALGNVLAIGTTITARRTSRLDRILQLLLWHHRFVLALVVPGAMAVFVTGAYLTYASGAPWTAGWLLGSVLVWAVSMAVGIVVLLPAERRATFETRALISAGSNSVSVALEREVAGAPVVLGEWGALAMVAVMFYLMLAKPF